jgi:hypothetical protein
MAAALLVVAAAAACSDVQPVAPHELPVTPIRVLQELTCAASITGTVSCAPSAGRAGGASRVIIGGQGTYLQLTSSNVSFDSATSILSADVTVKNLMNEAMGTPDGVVADPDGIQVFFHAGPTVTAGTGTVEVINADGIGTFTAGGQLYFAYEEILVKNEVSSPRTWEFEVLGDVETFEFIVYVEADVQYLLVINEVMVNPGGTVADGAGEWVEVYNAGMLPANLQGLVIADSSASGRRPYHVIASTVVVPAGGYVTLGNSADTTVNGGVPHDYVYAASLVLANSADAVKLARPYGTDTLDIDRTQYASAAISAKNGISRELKNPSLDNSNMDGSNWADASVTSVYGSGGRGTPKAQNSAYTP